MALKSKRKCRPKTRYTPTPEGYVMRAVSSLLTVHGIWHERRNVAKMQGAGGGFYSFGIKGEADYLALPIDKQGRRRILRIEVKALGKKQNPHQRLYEELCKKDQQEYLVVDDIDILIRYLKESGIR